MFVIVTADVHPRLTARLAFVVHQGSGGLFAFGGEGSGGQEGESSGGQEGEGSGGQEGEGSGGQEGEGSEEDVEMHGCARGRVGKMCGRGKVR
jgi:hypothetical protein